MARGKKLTYDQRKLLSKHGIEDCSDWLYIGMEINGENGSKSLSKSGNNEKMMMFKNRITDETMSVSV